MHRTLQTGLTAISAHVSFSELAVSSVVLTWGQNGKISGRNHFDEGRCQRFDWPLHKAVGAGGFIDGHHDFLGKQALVSILVVFGDFATGPPGKEVDFTSTRIAER